MLSMRAYSPRLRYSILNLNILASLFRCKHHQPTEFVLKNLGKFLACCEDVYLHYKLAYEHRLYDVVSVLLKDPQTGCCLKDMLAG